MDLTLLLLDEISLLGLDFLGLGIQHYVLRHSLTFLPSQKLHRARKRRLKLLFMEAKTDSCLFACAFLARLDTTDRHGNYHGGPALLHLLQEDQENSVQAPK